MQIELLTEDQQKTELTDLKDPFQKDKIIHMHMHVLKGLLTNKFSVSGAIKFKNGNTNGEQEFQAETFAGLLQKMQEFLNSL